MKNLRALGPTASAAILIGWTLLATGSVHAQVAPGSKPPLPISSRVWEMMQRTNPQALERWGADLPPVQAPTGPQTFVPAKAPAGSPPSPFSPEGAPVGSFTNLASTPGATLSNPQVLTDGTVIAHVSCSSTWHRLTPDINGSYVNGSWTARAITAMPAAHAPRFFGSGVLPDGRYIVAGGEYNGAGCPFVNTSQISIYDPAEKAPGDTGTAISGTWTTVTPPSGWASGIGDGQSTVLANGTYFQAAGKQTGPLAALLNPFNHTWTATGTGKFDAYNEEGFTLLPNGNVLTVDAYTDVTPCARNTEVYNPATGAWTSAGNTPNILADCATANAEAGSPTFEMGPQVMMYNGSVIAFGGNTANVTHTALFNTATSTWSAGPDLPQTCGGNAPPNQFCTLADAPAAILPNGKVLFAASQGAFHAPTHFFEYTPGSPGTISAAIGVGDTTVTSFQVNFVVLPTGQILRVNTDTNAVQVYTPDGSFAASLRPVVSSSPSCVSAGGTYFASGTQFNGLSEGAYYGDDSVSNTNFPLVRIQNNSTGHVFYARTFDHSSRSIASGAATSTKFKVPQVIEDGASTLYVVANGIPSVGTAVTVASSSCSKGGTTSATHDFNGSSGNPQSDIAWRNTSGATAIWFMFNATVNDTAGFGTVANTWSIVGQRDFNGDGAHDWLWRDTSGNLAIWFMFGALAPTTASLGNVPTAWVVQGTGDFNGDGKGDILWRNTSTNAVAIWLMNGSTVSSTATISTVPSNWVIAGTADFNGDGKTDILWRDSSTGAVAIWFINGTTVSSTMSIGSVPTNWVIAGTGDFNGDGKGDILWRDNTTGTVSIWLLNGGPVGATSSLGAVASNWVIANTGDFNGNGKTDILWRDTSSGAVAIWFIDRLSIASSASVGTVATSWVIQGLNAD
jgi:hypothetical protein